MTFEQGGASVLTYHGRLCVPMIDRLQERNMEEAHNSRYSFNVDFTKMYYDLREVYWLDNMKNDIEEFVTKSPKCQQVKVEHQRPGGLDLKTQLLELMWEKINMYFTKDLLRYRRKHDSILGLSIE